MVRAVELGEPCVCGLEHKDQARGCLCGVSVGDMSPLTISLATEDPAEPESGAGAERERN